MECIVCHVDFTDKALFRTNDAEYYRPEWMCLECMKQEKPELYEQAVSEYEEKLSHLNEY